MKIQIVFGVLAKEADTRRNLHSCHTYQYFIVHYDKYSHAAISFIREPFLATTNEIYLPFSCFQKVIKEAIKSQRYLCTVKFLFGLKEFSEICHG